MYCIIYMCVYNIYVCVIKKERARWFKRGMHVHLHTRLPGCTGGRWAIKESTYICIARQARASDES